MSRSASGTYTQPSGTTAVYDTPIDPNSFNSLVTDIAAALTDSLSRSGLGGMQAALNMGGFKVTNMGAPSASTDAATKGYVDTNTPVPSGTVMLFVQAAAPTGWTLIGTWNDRAIRINSSTGGTTHGTNPFSGFFDGSGTVTGTALSVNQLPAHNHSINDPGHLHSYLSLTSTVAIAGGGFTINYGPVSANTTGATTGITVNNTGSGDLHSHVIPALQYVDVITCQKKLTAISR